MRQLNITFDEKGNVKNKIYKEVEKCKTCEKIKDIVVNTMLEGTQCQDCVKTPPITI